VGGWLNQTTMVLEIARELPEAECVFTAYFADGLVGLAAARGLADFTILGGRPKAMSLAFLRAQSCCARLRSSAASSSWSACRAARAPGSTRSAWAAGSRR
jgi:hypothetical protein